MSRTIYATSDAQRAVLAELAEAPGGKFADSSPPFVPYYWELAQLDAADERTQCGKHVFALGADDLLAWSMLPGAARLLFVWEGRDGVVRHVVQ